MDTAAKDSWTLTPLELFVSCEVLGQRRLPFPLEFGPAPETEDEFRILRRRAAQALRDRMSERFELALTSLGDPWVRVQAVGGAAPATGAETEPIRLCACVGDDYAVVALQYPGASSGIGGQIKLSLHSRGEAATGVLAALPPNVAGREHGLWLEHSGSAAGSSDDHQPGFSVFDEGQHRPRRSAAATRALLERSPSLYCEIFAGPGTNPGPAAPTDGWSVAFADYPGDGRYLIERNGGVEAVPVAAPDLAARIDQQIGRAWHR